MAPDDVIALVKDAGLRGRGGAGLPHRHEVAVHSAGRRQAALPVVNADESEPGTCKDIPLLFANPHALIEGIIIACHAIRSNHPSSTCAVRPCRCCGGCTTRSREAYEAGYLGPTSPGSGLGLTSPCTRAPARTSAARDRAARLLEGRRGQPRLRPPFPAVAGLYACPTVVNNVESIASCPAILPGKEWFVPWAARSPRASPCTRCPATSPPRPVRGPARHHPAPAARPERRHARRPPAEVLDPGGSSTPIFTDEHLDVPLDYEGVGAAGSMLGTKALQCFDETTCVVRAVTALDRVLRARSCGKCTPCREGTYWLVQLLRDVETGKGTWPTSTSCPTSPTTSTASRSAPWATARPAPSSPRSSTSGRSTRSTSPAEAAPSTPPSPPLWADEPRTTEVNA